MYYKISKYIMITKKQIENFSIQELQKLLLELTQQEKPIYKKLSDQFDKCEIAIKIKQEHNGQYPINPNYTSCLLFFNNDEAIINSLLCLEYNTLKLEINTIQDVLQNKEKSCIIK